MLPSATAHAAAQKLYPRKLLASVTPATRGQRCPAIGRPGRTQPPCGRDRARRRESRRVRASGPAAAVLVPTCRARQHPRTLSPTPQSPPRASARTGGSAQRINASNVGDSRDRPPDAHWRCPAHPWQVGTSLSGPSAPAMYPLYECRYQRVSLSVTASARESGRISRTRV